VPDKNNQQVAKSKSAGWIVPGIVCLFIIGVIYWATQRANQATPQPAASTASGSGPVASMVPEVSGDTIPSYFASAEAAQPYPQTLPPEQFPNPIVARAYRVAKQIPGTLAQQPCYCFCYRTVGHRGLLDCYADLHGAACSVCVQEALLAEKLTKEGRTPAQIREAIIRGDWRMVELN
jgi:hypothetical protein